MALALPDYVTIIMLVVIFVYTVLVTAIPHPMTKLVSIPYIDQPRWQLGSSGLQFQVLLASVYHYRCITRTVHFTLLLGDYVCWFICLHGLAGWAGVGVLFGLMFLQHLTYRNRFTIAVALVAAGLIAAIEFLLLKFAFTLADAYLYAPWILLGTSAMRVMSHTFESMPPLVWGSDFTNFLSLPSIVLACQNLFCKCKCSMIPIYITVAFAGFVSEIQNGFPFRLFPGIVYILLNDMCCNCCAKFDWSNSVDEDVESIRKVGFDGWAVTKNLYTWVKWPVGATKTYKVGNSPALNAVSTATTPATKPQPAPGRGSSSGDALLAAPIGSDNA